jgi:glucokinase
MAFIGLDLGATKLAAAIFSEEGQILHRVHRLLEGRSGEWVGRLVSALLQNHVQQVAERGEVVQAVGVSVPGIAHDEDGTVWAPNIPGWERYPLRTLAQESLPSGTPLAIDNDRACSILGEAAAGAARGFVHAIFLAVGTGIGAGILIDGKVLRGAHDIGGAIGWMALDRPYRPEYDQCGCFETHASGAGIEKTARRLLGENPDHSGPLARTDPAKLTAHDVFSALDQGDAIAQTVLSRAIEYWGMAVANLVSLFNPQVIVVGGGIFGPAARFVDRIEAEARKWAQPISMRQVAIRPSALGPDACLHGTGRLARLAWESTRDENPS